MEPRSRGEMDITSVFGTAVPGSSPGESTGRGVSARAIMRDEADMV